MPLSYQEKVSYMFGLLGGEAPPPEVVELVSKHYSDVSELALAISGTGAFRALYNTQASSESLAEQFLKGIGGGRLASEDYAEQIASMERILDSAPWSDEDQFAPEDYLGITFAYHAQKYFDDPAVTGFDGLGIIQDKAGLLADYLERLDENGLSDQYSPSYVNEVLATVDGTPARYSVAASMLSQDTQISSEPDSMSPEQLGDTPSGESLGDGVSSPTAESSSLASELTDSLASQMEKINLVSQELKEQFLNLGLQELFSQSFDWNWMQETFFEEAFDTLYLATEELYQAQSEYSFSPNFSEESAMERVRLAEAGVRAAEMAVERAEAEFHAAVISNDPVVASKVEKYQETIGRLTELQFGAEILRSQIESELKNVVDRSGGADSSAIDSLSSRLSSLNSNLDSSRVQGGAHIEILVKNGLVSEEFATLNSATSIGSFKENLRAVENQGGLSSLSSLEGRMLATRWAGDAEVNGIFSREGHSLVSVLPEAALDYALLKAESQGIAVNKAEDGTYTSEGGDILSLTATGEFIDSETPISNESNDEIDDSGTLTDESSEESQEVEQVEIVRMSTSELAKKAFSMLGTAPPAHLIEELIASQIGEGDAEKVAEIVSSSVEFNYIYAPWYSSADMAEKFVLSIARNSDISIVTVRNESRFIEAQLDFIKKSSDDPQKEFAAFFEQLTDFYAQGSAVTGIKGFGALNDLREVASEYVVRVSDGRLEESAQLLFDVMNNVDGSFEARESSLKAIRLASTDAETPSAEQIGLGRIEDLERLEEEVYKNIDSVYEAQADFFEAVAEFYERTASIEHTSEDDALLTKYWDFWDAKWEAKENLENANRALSVAGSRENAQEILLAKRDQEEARNELSIVSRGYEKIEYELFRQRAARVDGADEWIEPVLSLLKTLEESTQELSAISGIYRGLVSSLWSEGTTNDFDKAYTRDLARHYDSSLSVSSVSKSLEEVYLRGVDEVAMYTGSGVLYKSLAEAENGEELIDLIQSSGVSDLGSALTEFQLNALLMQFGGDPRVFGYFERSGLNSARAYPESIVENALDIASIQGSPVTPDGQGGYVNQAGDPVVLANNGQFIQIDDSFAPLDASVTSGWMDNLQEGVLPELPVDVVADVDSVYAADFGGGLGIEGEAFDAIGGAREGAFLSAAEDLRLVGLAGTTVTDLYGA